MKGIIFRDYFIQTFLYVLFSYILIVQVFGSLLEEDENKDQEKSKKRRDMSKDKPKIRDIMASIFMIGIILLFFILAIRLQIKPILIPLNIFSIITGIIIVPYAFWNFIRYVFIRPLDFMLTKRKENVLEFVGVVMLFICGHVSKNGNDNKIIQFIFNSSPIISDLSLMTFLVIWYFSVMFFTASFFILSLHKINVVIINRLRKTEKSKQQKDRQKEKYKHSLFADQISPKIDDGKNLGCWAKVFLYVLWFICILTDTIIIILNMFIIGTWERIKLLILLILKMFRRILKCISEVLSGNQGKNIIIISRFSLICSLIIIYLIDKYRDIFTTPGSSVYEFMCSVIIIPLLITQIMELRGQQKDS